MLVNYTRKYEKVSILASALMLIVALFLIFKPAESLSLITILFGLIIMIDGVIHIINYFKIDPTQKLMSFELIEGLIEVFAGAVITVCADALIEFLPIIFAIWIILKSLITFQMALNIKSVPNTSWGLMVIVAIIGILLGLITSIPELITFIESQRHHSHKDTNEGIVEATSNLLFSNLMNLFVIQSVGIFIFLIFA